MPVTVGQKMGWGLLIELSAPISDVRIVEGIGPQRKCSFYSSINSLSVLFFYAQKDFKNLRKIVYMIFPTIMYELLKLLHKLSLVCLDVVFRNGCEEIIYSLTFLF